MLLLLDEGLLPDEVLLLGFVLLEELLLELLPEELLLLLSKTSLSLLPESFLLSEVLFRGAV